MSYFSKIGISHSVPQVIGTELHFEYRQLIQEEREQSLLFHSDSTLICNSIIAPPPTSPFIITKLLNYKKLYLHYYVQLIPSLYIQRPILIL